MLSNSAHRMSHPNCQLSNLTMESIHLAKSSQQNLAIDFLLFKASTFVISRQKEGEGGRIGGETKLSRFFFFFSFFSGLDLLGVYWAYWKTSNSVCWERGGGRKLWLDKRCWGSCKWVIKILSIKINTANRSPKAVEDVRRTDCVLEGGHGSGTGAWGLREETG